MHTNNDQQQIAKVLAGDTNAYAVLVDRYKYMVFTLAFKLIKNREDAEEVAQDVFLKSFKALRTFKGDAKFSTWLYKIAYYRSLDYVKKNKRKLSTSTADVSEAYNIGTQEMPSQAIEAAERKAIIKGAMNKLASEDNVLLTLHYFEELSLREISEVMGITVNTAKVRLFRSRKRLGELLIKEPEIAKDYGNQE